MNLISKSALSLMCIAGATTACLAAASISQAGLSSSVAAVAGASGAPADFTKAAESSIDGVVSIRSFATPRMNNSQWGNMEMFDDPFFDFFFGTPRQQQRRQPRRQQNDERNQQPLGLGSGVILSSDGYIVTNNHVIDGAERLEVTLNDNRSFNATVVGADPSTDLALIKISASDLPIIKMGDSDNLKIGEWVLAVGNPFGLTSTVTAGIVSAKTRSISSATHQRPMSIESYIQTDAAVNPGNSGGALVNLNGELIGINTAIYSQTGNYAGYSFAIPVSIVKKIVADLKQFGTVQRAVLGVTYTELTPKLAKEKEITSISQGLYINSVADQSAAMEAGLKAGDVIVSIDGQPTNNSSQLLEQISRHSPGDKISIGYVRDNKKYTVQATLYNNQGSTKITKAKSMADLGCAFKKPAEETLKSLKISGGMQVTGLKAGPFKDAGIKDGFIITEINQNPVNSTDDIEKIYDSIMKGNDSDKVMFIIGFYPTGKKMPYAVDLADAD